MATEQNFLSDLRLPLSPPTEDKALYEQLEYLYRAVRILASALTEGDFLTSASAPATATSPGIAGSLAYDSSYLYICIATDTWRRIPHAAW